MTATSRQTAGAISSVEEVVLGVDTHLDLHVAVALDQLGRRLDSMGLPTTTKGYNKLLHWAQEFGPVTYAGVEGTSSYGAGLTRYLQSEGVEVLEVERPKRRHLHRNGKSDPIDAEAAARAVLSGEATGEPKTKDGTVEMIRALRVARSSAIKARTQTANQLKNLLVTAPEELGERLHGLSTRKLVSVAARFRPGSQPNDVHSATKFAMRCIARRNQSLSEEIAELEAQIERLLDEVAPQLVSLPFIGTASASMLLTVAGDNPERLKTEASFASLCGVSPVEASSGKVVRHRLNRGGDRDANSVLHMICVRRMGRDGRTKEYVARRTAEGKSQREIMRCLKRYIAREVYRAIVASRVTRLPEARDDPCGGCGEGEPDPGADQECPRGLLDPVNNYLEASLYGSHRDEESHRREPAELDADPREPTDIPADADGRLFVEIGASSAQTAWRDWQGNFRFAPGIVQCAGWPVALACPGLVRDGRVLYATNLGWPDDADPAAQLGLEHVGLVVNDAEVAALGESILRYGKEPGVDLHYLSLGTGVGAARVQGGVAADTGLGHLHIGGSNYCEGCRSVGCLNSELEARRLPESLTREDELFVARTLADALRAAEVEGDRLVVLGGGIARSHPQIVVDLGTMVPNLTSITVAPAEAKSSAYAGLECLFR